MRTNSERGMKRLIIFASALLLATVVIASIGRKVRAAGPTFTTIDFPGSVADEAVGVNDSGQIVGEYTFSGLGDRQGFLLSNGVFTSISYPGSTFTRAEGINRQGDIVGDYQKAGNNNGFGNEYGYLLRGGVFTPIVFPNSDTTVPTGINSSGDIVGYYIDKIGTHGFLFLNGAYTSIDFPRAAAFTQAWRINDYGEIAGRYRSSKDSNYHIFVLNGANFMSVPDVPGALQTAPGKFSEVGGLNNGGDIAGHYCSSKSCAIFTSVGDLHAFLLTGGVYTTIDFPGAVETFAYGVNSYDDVVGSYEDSSGRFHGYLRTP
jgi:uncharacterized membrane protein